MIVRRAELAALAALLAVLILVWVAPAAVAAPANHNPVRFWSVSKVVQGTGEVPVADGAQVGDVLQKSAELGNLVFNLPLHAPYWYFLPRDRAFGSAFSSANGHQYSVMAQAPIPNPLRVGQPKGGVTHLDEYQAYEKRTDDAFVRITLSDLLLQTIDDNNRFAAWECPSDGACDPVRTIVRFHARAYAASAGGDFFTAGGTAYLEGHQHSWRPGAATAADSPGPLWGESDFDVDGDADDSNTGAAGVMDLNKPIRVKIPLGAVRRGELFAVHVSLEAEAVDDRGGESAAQAFIQDPQHVGGDLLATHGLTPRGRPRFKEPRATQLRPALCRAGRPAHAGTIAFSAPRFTANESERAPMILVTRTGGSRGAASATVTTGAGTAKAGGDFRPTTTTVRFAAGDTSPRLVEIPLREDRTVERAETFTVALEHARCAGLGTRRHATVRIIDDDQGQPQPPAPPTPTIGGPVTGPPGGGLVPASSGLDLSFGGGSGRVSTPVGGFGHGEALVIQPSGAIVTAGWRITAAGEDFALTRHDAAGNLDPAFGPGGTVTTDFGGTHDEALDAALPADGGIVAVGSTDVTGVQKLDFALARYGVDGGPAAGFGSGGRVTTDVRGGADQANAVAVQPDGKIVAAGFATDAAAIDSDFAVVRYKADGTLDQSFGTAGIVTTDLGTRSDDARAIAIQPDGAIVVAGTAGDDVALARYLPGGALDPGFGQGGTTITDLGSDEVATGVALIPGGQIAVAGYTVGPRANRDFLLIRYGADGTIDTTFANHGAVTTDLLGGDDFAENVAVDGAGRIVLVGRATSTTILDMALVRYRPDGTLDTSFDGDGIVTADFHGRGEFGQDLAFDAAGRILAAGYTANGGNTEFALMRVNP